MNTGRITGKGYIPYPIGVMVTGVADCFNSFKNQASQG